MGRAVKMKYLYLSLLILLSFNLNSQSNTPILKRTVTIKVNNETVGRVMDIISETAAFSFSYNSSIIKTSRLVNINAENRTVKEVLDQLFNNSLSYQQIGNHLILQKIIAPKKKVKNATKTTYFYNIKGYIRDVNNGNPLRETSVYEPKTLSSAISGDFGFFELNITTSTPQLQVNFRKAGYFDTAIPVSWPLDKEPISLNLMPLIENIETTDSLTSEEDSVWTKIVSDTPKPLVKILPKDFKLNFDPIARKIIGLKQRIHDANVKDTFDRKFQFTLFPPIGTNYKLSNRVNNLLSINLIAGYNGGVKGLELGGFLNLIERNVSGAQFAGFGNVVGGNTNGLQASGFFNHNNGKTSGVQLAGFSNSNISGGNGLQAAGFANFNKKTFRGTQIAGFGNWSGEQSNAAQIAGFGNFSTNVNGAQVAGFINIADTLNGIQVGFINIARHAKGVQLGFFNFAKNGIHQLELNSSDVSPISIGYRSGTKAFYTGFSIGLGHHFSNSLWHYGFSAGSRLLTVKKFSANLEITSSQWMKGAHINYLNLLNRADLMLQFQIVPKFALAIGPAWNVWVYDNRYPNEHFVYLQNMPIASHSQTSGNVDIRQWLGWKAAIRFF